MRILSNDERKVMESNIRVMLSSSVGNEYSERILNYEIAYDGSRTMMDEIVEDICVSSEWEDTGGYTLTDIQFAIGRSICKCIGTDF